jgi:hypothetical protein
LYVEAEIGRGRNGYTVEDDNGTYRLFNVATEEFYELDGGIPNEFESYKEARETAQDQGLYRAWNEIKKFEASEVHIESNQQVIAGLSGEQLKGSL